MSEKEELPSTSKSAGALSRPTLSLPPRPFSEMFVYGGGVGFSPGPMTLVSNMFSDTDESSRSFSQLLAGVVMPSPAAGSEGNNNSNSSSSGVVDVVDPRFKQSRPAGLMVSQSPSMFTAPPGLSPAMRLDSPSFLGLFSPLQVLKIFINKFLFLLRSVLKNLFMESGSLWLSLLSCFLFSLLGWLLRQKDTFFIC